MEKNKKKQTPHFFHVKHYSTSPRQLAHLSFPSCMELAGGPLLRQRDDRRQIYFSVGGPHPGLEGWLQNCHRLVRRRGYNEQHIIDRLRLIKIRIELRRKFRDWYNFLAVRRRARLWSQQRYFKNWRKLFLLSRYKPLFLLLTSLRPWMRHCFLDWKEKTKILRAIAFRNKMLQRRIFSAWKQLLQRSHRSLLVHMTNRWKNMIIFLRKLKKIVSFT